MSTIAKPLADWLRDSLRSGLLFGRADEPLDDYGRRLVRVILAEVEPASSQNAEAPPSEPATSVGAQNSSSSLPGSGGALRALIADQRVKVIKHLIQLAGRVTKSRPGQFCFQVLRRDRDDGTIEYQIFADTKGNGTQIAYVQSTRHDAEFIAACLAQAPLFAQLFELEALAEARVPPSLEPTTKKEQDDCTRSDLPTASGPTGSSRLPQKGCQ